MLDLKAKSERWYRKIWEGSAEEMPLNQSLKNGESCNREGSARSPHTYRAPWILPALGESEGVRVGGMSVCMCGVAPVTPASFLP